MNRRICGVIFCCMGALIYVVRHIIAAILGSQLTALSTEMYKSLLRISGTELLYISTAYILFGIVYIVVSEIVEILNKKR